MRLMRPVWISGVLVAAMVLLCGAFNDSALAQRNRVTPNFDFLSPPSTDANRIYRVNIYSGEMSVCWYEKQQGLDTTRCLGPGEGAGPQERGLYTLVATNMQKEKGVFRVNLVTGTVSVCWVKGDQLVCTPPAN